MKISLDENLPTSLKAIFRSQFAVKTVHEMNWLGKNNGELLELMIFHGFDIFIPGDKNLQYQQNLDKFNISIFILDAVNNRPETFHSLIEKTITRINSSNLQKLTIIS